MLLKDISNLISSLFSILGDILFLKSNISSCSYCNLLQHNGLRQILATATRLTINSSYLVDPIFYFHCLDNSDSCILDTGSTDHCVRLLKLTFSIRKKDDTGTASKHSLFNRIEKARQFDLEIISKKLKRPNLYDDLHEQFDLFLESVQNVLKNAVKESNTKRKNVNHLGSSKKIEKAFSQEKQAMKLSKFLPTGLN